MMMRFGARRVLIVGMSLAVLGLGWFVQVPVRDAYVVDVLPALLVLGLGIGGSFPALMAMAGAGPEDAGLVNTTAQVAMAANEADVVGKLTPALCAETA